MVLRGQGMRRSPPTDDRTNASISRAKAHDAPVTDESTAPELAPCTVPARPALGAANIVARWRRRRVPGSTRAVVRGRRSVVRLLAPRCDLILVREHGGARAYREPRVPELHRECAPQGRRRSQRSPRVPSMDLDPATELFAQEPNPQRCPDLRQAPRIGVRAVAVADVIAAARDRTLDLGTALDALNDAACRAACGRGHSASRARRWSRDNLEELF